MRKREEGSQYLRTLFIYAVKQVLSREEMRIRLSRWQELPSILFRLFEFHR